MSQPRCRSLQRLPKLRANPISALTYPCQPYQGEPSEPYAGGDLGIDFAQHRVTLAGRPVQLTATEYALLYELAAHAGRVLTHDALLQRVWGPERTGEPGLVREVVQRLRRKLGDDAGNPAYIFTEPRLGYRMAEGGSQEEASP